jgi:hypothetical protein
MEAVQNLFSLCITRKETQHYLLAGVEQVGKTTLLYRLKAPRAPNSDVISKITGVNQARDALKGKAAEPSPGAGSGNVPAESAEEGENGAENGATEEGPKKGGNAWTFHFEMFDGYGVWDFPGNRSCRVLLADMYRSVAFHAVLFVVNCEDLRTEERPTDGDEWKEDPAMYEHRKARIMESRKLLRFLLYEDELRLRPFAVIVNEHRSLIHQWHNKAAAKRDGPCPEQYEPTDNRFWYELGIEDLSRDDPIIANRVKLFVLDCAALTHGTADQRWRDVLSFVQNYKPAKGEKKKKG